MVQPEVTKSFRQGAVKLCSDNLLTQGSYLGRQNGFLYRRHNTSNALWYNLKPLKGKCKLILPYLYTIHRRYWVWLACTHTNTHKLSCSSNTACLVDGVELQQLLWSAKSRIMHGKDNILCVCGKLCYELMKAWVAFSLQKQAVVWFESMRNCCRDRHFFSITTVIWIKLWMHSNELQLKVTSPISPFHSSQTDE